MLKFLKNDNRKKSLESLEQKHDSCTLEEAEKIFFENHDYTYTHSNNIKLHRNLLDILNDKTIISFFIQYLESKNGLPLVKFWLDVETFKAVGSDSISSCDRSESRISNYDNPRKEHRRRKSDTGCDTFRDYDCVSTISTATSISNFDETEELHSNNEDTTEIVERMTQSLTDDEKSKICEKSRKKDDCDIIENNNNNNSNNNIKQDESDTKSSDESRKFKPLVLEDALRIYRKYLVTDSTYSIELPATILAKLSLALCGNDSDSEIDLNNLWQAFDEAQRHIFDVMEKEYLCEFLDSQLYNKYTVDILTTDSLCIDEVLCSESALFFFMEFLEGKEKRMLPYIEFWLSATNFRKQFDNYEDFDDNQSRSDALVIYEKWFSLQATSPLNFSNQIRVKIEEKICSTSSPTCFDAAIRIVEIYLERNCFKKFVCSDLFFKHLSEIMSKIDINDKNLHSGIIRRNSSFTLKFPSKGKHRRTNSETFDKKGLTRSISAQNTLLAGLDYKRNNRNSTDLQIDSRQLIDPDLLWRRENSTTKLSFGRVDAFGRFERDFEMPETSHIPTSRSFQFQNDSIDIDDPQSIFDQTKWNSTQNRLKNAVRKLVHLPDDTVQQEIAWQVAELIVKDVTNITLQNENLNHS